MTQNINSLGLIAKNTEKLAEKELMLEKGVDVMGMQENNVCWHEVSNANKIWNQLRG